MDNKVFNVNGATKNQLLATLKLAMLDEYDTYRKAVSYEIDKKHGFVLNQYGERGIKFPAFLEIETITEIVWAWLQTDEAKSMSFEGWDADADHDGSNHLGFRVYCEDWGFVGDNQSAIIAIRPAYCWYGK